MLDLSSSVPVKLVGGTNFVWNIPNSFHDYEKYFTPDAWPSVTVTECTKLFANNEGHLMPPMKSTKLA